MGKTFIPPSGIVAGSSVSLVVGRYLRNAHRRIAEIKQIFNYMYDKECFFEQNFEGISLLFIYGIKTDLTPKYDKIHVKSKDLPIKIEFDTLILDWADKNNPELLKEIYLIGACEAVLHVLRKYKLPTEQVEKIRAKLGDIPVTIEECQAWKQKTPLTSEAILGYTPDPWPVT